MRIVRAVVGCVACLGCDGGITGSAKGTTYTSDFSVQFVEASVHQGGIRLTCNDTYNLTGTVTVVLRASGGSTVNGDGRVDARQNWLSVSGQGCTRGSDRSTSGEWSTDLTGSPSQFGFTVKREGSPPFVMATTYAFTGALSGSQVNGTLVFTQTGRGVTGGTTQSTSDATASVSVTLR